VSDETQTSRSETRHKRMTNKLPELDSYLHSLPSSGKKIVCNSNSQRKNEKRIKHSYTNVNSVKLINLKAHFIWHGASPGECDPASP